MWLKSLKETWLGHVARMDNDRLPKQLLFEELTQPSQGTKKRWRDLAARNVQAIGLGGMRQYCSATPTIQPRIIIIQDSQIPIHYYCAAKGCPLFFSTTAVALNFKHEYIIILM